LKLGLMSFGGPIAHLAYLRAEFVDRRKWLDSAAYADLVALCQFLPGPASSQVGMALGALRAGVPGAVAAWLGFTLPSALIMVAFGYGVHLMGDVRDAGWLHGLKIAAVAVVAQAVWSMGRQLCPDAPRASLAVTAAGLALMWPGTGTQVGVIAASGVVGWAWLNAGDAVPDTHADVRLGRRTTWVALPLFFGLLVLLPVLARATTNHAIALVDGFYRAGALVFGGGHVVLPLLRTEVVPPGWISDDMFLAGYGMAQALPGPLFTFAAYLGTVMEGSPSGWSGGLLALGAVFLPSFLLVLGVLPSWTIWRRKSGMRAALNGVNAAVVGLLLSALYDPVFTGAVQTRADFTVAAAAVMLLVVWNVSPLWVVLWSVMSGMALAFL